MDLGLKNKVAGVLTGWWEAPGIDSLTRLTSPAA